ncbi:TIGR01458 family HAD-type hydrolase [Flammeovirga yaeyamensis]|uniref:Haloacid dehalogenase-like hydrolase domain-containing protein 2 n=1 Tax=Flammeovirga yaeyamensis TaxID=367791 RepID=A0AAX1NAM1_9BACT|nr:TIGR01458 family HAD-type hydrolase [Flammeovirga yaeyamensis]MBB3697918.1 HAD superfamily hydrolase (TIGR01458 family) [Flammeovirga yaeyamensis]NMF35727.1 TIGR01458 family HAD-type hydrolase [Flammeovirga yaeyamensis]QWG03320.1 TIGR01458 family HAD-type hydrolase [Flammeovirga yaeyamensis]
MKNIKGILCDLDGVLYNDSVLIEGVIDSIKTLKNKGYSFLFVTNTSGITSEELFDKLIKMGIPVGKDEILSPPLAAYNYVSKMRYNNVEVLGGTSVRNLFYDNIKENTIDPEVIVVGDIGKNWDYALMNNLFNKILNGSKVVGLHKGKFWKAADGLRIDIGAFITGLEFATSTQSVCIGKPEKAFYESAIEKIGLSADELLMIGDDIVGDIQGAKSANLTAIQVKTGKYRKELTDNSPVQPDYLIENFNDLVGLLIK